MRSYVVRGLVATATALPLLLSAACGPERSEAGKPVAQASATLSPTPSPTGNGVADKSADEILKAARAALVSAQSVHIKGKITEDGESIGIDMWLSGNAAKGTMTVPLKGKSVPVDIISARGKIYFHGSKFWRVGGGAAFAELIGDRWVLIPKNDKDFKDLESLFNIKKFAKEVLTPDGSVTKGKQTVINGKPAIGLDDGDGILYVATTGKPYPLTLTPTAPETAGDGLAFLAFDVPLTVSPPAHPIDMSKL